MKRRSNICIRFRVPLIMIAVECLAATAGNPVVVGRDPDYLREVRPLLQSRCFSCHGALKQEASLRLDTAALILQGGESGPGIIREKAAESRLIERVASTDSSRRMPPEEDGDALSAEQIQLLRDWIDQGARAPADEQPEPDPQDHWAFREIRRPEIPQSIQEGRSVTAVDALIEAEHESQGLVPQSEAPREILLRRLYLDLVGVTPTAIEIRQADNDLAADWYEKTVERLLADRRHGERWARHWMDVWRYSDWWGLGDQLRNSQVHIWHWRDWIVESLNADTPYDEMVRQMLAADELYPEDLSRLRATGYLARNYFLFNRNQWMEETVEHVGKGFLGLTLNCAKCHDHKYDPVSQTDFYRMRAFFEPYHIRVDVVPGESDLSRNGIPRVFDGLPDLPTYRFVRGQENAPDKSQVILPGLPDLFSKSHFSIAPVALPLSAWQPERRPWVLADALANAEQKLALAEAAVGVRNAPGDTTANGAGHRVAELATKAARAELLSVQRRVEATRAAWAVEDAAAPGNPDAPPGVVPPGANVVPADVVTAERTAARAAERAEREAAVARARHAVAEAEFRASAASDDDQKQKIAKELTAAGEKLAQAEQQLAEEPRNQYTKFSGAAWTPTRFFSSVTDDPAVVFHRQSTGRRTALARWITDPHNPLTARVAANHVWMRHLGTPLVASVFDFGQKGTRPVHPELVDWLAVELMDSGWSLKHLHRVIVNSAAYRRSSSTAGAAASLAIDPDNRFLWRRTSLRLESQVVRDSVLSLAGILDETMGGPPVPAAQQADSRRRSLYFFHSNNDRNLFLTTFDEALVKDCYRREQSIVPQQALAMTNSRLVLDSAPLIAVRISEDAGGDREFIQAAFRLLLGIRASESEIAACQSSLSAWKNLKDSDSVGDAAVPARAHLIRALLNHNDFVTLR